MEDHTYAIPEIDEELSPIESPVRRRKRRGGLLRRMYEMMIGDRFSKRRGKKRRSDMNRSFITYEYDDTNIQASRIEEDGRMEQRNLFRSSASPPTQPAFIPPPMPYFGHTVDIKELRERNKRARKVMSEIMSTVSADINTSIDKAKQIPVAAAGERVAVSTEIYDMIAASRTKKDIILNYRANLSRIEGCLVQRQLIIDVMNDNIDNIQVQANAPVDIKNARSVTVTK